MLIEILSAVPDIVRGPLSQSILHRASMKELVEVRVHDLRDYSTDKHRKVDDYPYGGGPGMVLTPDPIFSCYDAISRRADMDEAPIDAFIYLSPDGDRLTQEIVNELSMLNHLVMLAGHYKGVDQRVRDQIVTREISIGDYVLSGGELPALVLVDAIVRLVPGVLGDTTSALSDSFQDGLLDAPSYTRPAIFRGLEVPQVLRSGDHDAIAGWREEAREQKTAERRPDMYERSASGPSRIDTETDKTN